MRAMTVCNARTTYRVVVIEAGSLLMQFEH